MKNDFWKILAFELWFLTQGRPIVSQGLKTLTPTLSSCLIEDKYRKAH